MGIIQQIEEFKLSKKFKYFFFGLLCVLFPLVITIYGIVYFGGLWNPIKRLNNLSVALVNNDKGCAGQGDAFNLCTVLTIALSQQPQMLEQIKQMSLGALIVQNLKSNDQAKNVFRWKEDKTNYAETKDNVERYERWGAMYIPEDFTVKVLSNMDFSMFTKNQTVVQQMVAAYAQLKQKDPQAAQADLMEALTPKKTEIDYIYDTARSYTSVTFVATAFETIDDALKKGFPHAIYQRAQASGGMLNFPNSFYMEPYESKYVDIHPVTHFGQNFASFMLFVVIYIAAIATNLVYRKYRPFNNYIQSEKTNTSILLSAVGKIGINMIYMLIVSAFMMLVMFMFGGGQHEKNLFCTYLIFVLWAFICLTFCHIVSNLLPLLPFLGICVIFLVIQLATCGGIVANRLQPKFWNVGKALPMYYATAEMRYLLFGTGGRFNGRNILALCLWALGLAIFDILTGLVQLNNVRKAAPQTTNKRDLEKQEMTKNDRVTRQDIENANAN